MWQRGFILDRTMHPCVPSFIIITYPPIEPQVYTILNLTSGRAAVLEVPEFNRSIDSCPF